MDYSTGMVGPAEYIEIKSILQNFLPENPISSVSFLGDGNINKTYLIKFTNNFPVVLQRINAEVFPEPARVAENVSLVTRHLLAKQPDAAGGEMRLRVLPARDGKNFYQDDIGGTWRLLTYVENSISYHVVQSAAQAFEGGKILGQFHHLLDDFDPGQLHDPLPGFHDLPGYCRHYLEVLVSHRRSMSTDLSYCCKQADARLTDACLLEEANRDSKIVCRVIHGDPKIDNVLFDRDTGRAVAMIDLDTVSSGLLQYDLGDCLRSFCNPVGEQSAILGKVNFDLDICNHVLAGYKESGARLLQSERNLVYQGVRLLTFELALRFLTDYLEGNRYFKVADEQENLHRAVSQFQLLDCIEKQQREIQLIAAAI